MYSSKMSFSLIFTLLYVLMPCLLSSVCFIEACSSRTVPKPRPSTISSSSSSSSSMAVAPARYPAATTTRAPLTTIIPITTTTARPNITFPTYKCPATYDAWYCLNEATCFSVKIGDSIMYNCECAIGFMGPRCEYKELDGSYMPKRPRPLLEKASIASGATLAILFILFVCLTIYLRYDQKANFSKQEDEDYFHRGNSLSSTGCRYCKQNCCRNDDATIKERDDRNNDDDGDNNEMIKGYSSKSNSKWWLSRVAELGVFGDAVLADAGGDFNKAKPMTYAVKRNAKM